DRRPPGFEQRSRRRAGRYALLGAALLCALSGDREAHAAQFTLSDGAQIEGRVTALSGRFVRIETAEGARLLLRNSLTEVELDGPRGVRLRGRLENWRDGDYTLRTADGMVIARDQSENIQQAPQNPGSSPSLQTEAPARQAQATGPSEAQTPQGQGPERSTATTAATAGDVTGSPAPAAEPNADAPSPSWMSSPQVEAEANDNFQVLVAERAGDGAFENRDARSDIDTSKPAQADAPTVAAAPDLTLRRPDPAPGAAPGTGTGTGFGPAGGDRADEVRGLLDDILGADTRDGAADLRNAVEADEAGTEERDGDAATGAGGSGTEVAQAPIASASAEPPSLSPRRLRQPAPAQSAPADVDAPPAAFGPDDVALKAAYLDGVLFPEDAPGAPRRARQCARLSGLLAAPAAMEASVTAGAASQRDPLRVAITGDMGRRAMGGMARAFYARLGVRIQSTDAPGLDPRSPLADAARTEPIEVDALEPRLRGPDQIVLATTRPGGDGRWVGDGEADVKIGPAFREVLPDLSGRIIGFDAIALVAPRESGLRALSLPEVGQLLSGEIRDWSALNRAGLDGKPVLYLPELGSEELHALSRRAGVRRVRPASARYIRDPARRLAAAQADPMGLAVTVRSALEGVEALAIGPSDEEAAGLDLDTLRRGAYPLMLPLYAQRPAPDAHPASIIFIEYLSSPPGQRALFDDGLVPVAACDPTTCALDAPGIDTARARHTRAVRPELRLAPQDGSPAEAVDPVVDFAYPSGRQALSAAAVADLAAQIGTAARAAKPEQRFTAIAVVAPQADAQATDIAQPRLALALARAEAAALAHRCAGLAVTTFGVETAPDAQPDAVRVRIRPARAAP
ncbi:MAG: hypothetical protein AAF909_12715, partial [Pseudomonadota bacterium]